ncbi:MAG TPA: BMP family protein [Bauldia sp.]|nr:BMP family protein [Bauldia sp.]
MSRNKLPPSTDGIAKNVIIMNRRTVLGTLGAAAASTMILAATGGKAVAKTFKAGGIFYGQVKVGNFEPTGYNAFQAMAKKYGIETEYAESIDFDKAKEPLTDFGNRGFDLVVAHSSGYQAAVLDVAPKFPNTWFVLMVDGDSTGNNPNVAVYGFSTYEVLYLPGAVAGLMTKTNKIGLIGAIPLPGIRAEMAGFIDGAKAVNPAVEVESIWINSFTDAAKAKEASLAMIGHGADVVGHAADSASEGIFQASREKGTKAIGAFADEGLTNGDVVLVSGLYNEDLTWDLVGKGLTEGSLKPTITFGGIKEGWVSLGGYHDVPQDVQDKIAKLRDDIASGKTVLTPRMVPEK